MQAFNSGPSCRPPAVLVVDDDVLVRMVIADYLRDCGYEVMEAGDGDEACKVLADAATAIDVVFSDVQMPGGMDGFDLARWVNHERPQVRVVLTSGVARTDGGVPGVGPLLEKPYNVVEVERRVRALIPH